MPNISGVLLHILTIIELFCLQKFLQVSAEQEFRRGGSYMVELKAAGGSRVNAHSLTPTLSVPYSVASAPVHCSTRAVAALRRQCEKKAEKARRRLKGAKAPPFFQEPF